MASAPMKLPTTFGEDFSECGQLVNLGSNPSDCEPRTQFRKPLLGFVVESVLRDEYCNPVWVDDFGCVCESVDFVFVEGAIFDLADYQSPSLTQATSNSRQTSSEPG